MTLSASMRGLNPQCLLVAGTEPGCGKSVFACGIAGALRQDNFETRVVKPLTMSSQKDSKAEYAFLGSVGQTPINYPVTYLDRPIPMRETNWHNAIMSVGSTEQLTFVEMVGGVATPLYYEQNNVGTLLPTWRDATDLAQEFKSPCIVVAKHQTNAIEQIILAISYIRSKGIEVVACASVEVVQDGGLELERRRNRADFTVGLFERTRVPYMGCIKYNPGISVQRVTQGNLVQAAAGGLDLRPIMKALNLGVPA